MDSRFREAERRAKVSGDVADVAAYYLERIRAGLTTETYLQFAAFIGDPAANLALGTNLSITIPELAKFGVLSKLYPRSGRLSIDSRQMIKFGAIECSDEVREGVLGTILETIRIKIIAALDEELEQARQTIKFESQPTRSAYLAQIGLISGVLERFSTIPTYEPNFPGLVRETWALLGSFVMNPVLVETIKKKITENVRNVCLHRWGLH